MRRERLLRQRREEDAEALAEIHAQQLLSVTLPGNRRPRGGLERLAPTHGGEGSRRGFRRVWYAVDR